jgi:hypothetical protein
MSAIQEQYVKIGIIGGTGIILVYDKDKDNF